VRSSDVRVVWEARYLWGVPQAHKPQLRGECIESRRQIRESNRRAQTQARLREM